MDDVKRKVYLDLFASPVVLLPLVGGLTALLASWAIGGQGWLTFAGLAGVLTGIGTFATRLIYGLEGLTDRAYQYQLEKLRAQKERELQQLRQMLEQDDDPRTEQLLQQLEATYAKLAGDIREGRIPAAAQGVVQSVEQMFHVCLEYLERTWKLWSDAQKVDGIARRRLLQQREELVGEVKSSVDFLGSKLGELHELNTRKGKSELSRLRDELDESIRAARQAEQRVEAIGREILPEGPL